MKLKLTTNKMGIKILKYKTLIDKRGVSSELWNKSIEDAFGMRIQTTYLSDNISSKTLRGFHYQIPPCAQAKVVTCISGGFYDVVVDLRPTSPTFLRCFEITLTSYDRIALYIPVGFAHAFQTISIDTTILYFLSTEYSPKHSRIIRWNDPILCAFPVLMKTKNISKEDEEAPDVNIDELKSLIWETGIDEKIDI